MDKWWLIVTFSVAMSSLAEPFEESVQVSTDSGILQGFKMTSRSGRSYHAFSKIPYAKPPVGSLRFKRADRDVKWEGVLKADQMMPDCLQIPFYEPLAKNETIGVEDCLYLSVFTPKVGKENKIPVMIYIHGGGWRSELPHIKSWQFSQFLLDEDVVLVHFHYRLGPLGFLSTEDSVLPGNLGLKDQVDLILWVKNNIAHFGGDGNKITLFGNSAGGASTHYHLVSPMSKDLIQGGISQSGVATCLWAFSVPGVASARAKMLARHLQCPEEPSEKLLSCLRTKSPFDITNAERIFSSRDFDPVTVFQPVIESGPHAFLQDSPYNLKVEKPWIIGVTSEDGAFKTAGYLFDPYLMESLIENGAGILPNAFMFENTTENPQEVASTILNQYQINEKAISNFSNMWTDGFFTHGMVQALTVSNGKAYVYVFEHRAKTLNLDLLAQAVGISTGDLGVSHTDELRSLFNFDDQLVEASRMTTTDMQVSQRVVKIWADFSKHGFPKSVNDWKQYGHNKNYLRIGNTDIAEENWWHSRVEFWKNLPVRSRLEKLKL